MHYSNLRTILRNSRRLCAVLLVLATSTVRAEIDVVATIVPIHSLVAGVMDGVASPTLLLRANVSPHSYQLRPSDARALEDADIVFWVGPTLETFLEGPLTKIAKKADVVALMDNADLSLLPARKGGTWEEDEHHHEHATALDPHIWLDPNNAKVIVEQVSAALAKADSPNAHTYRRNARQVIARIDAMSAQGKQSLATVGNTPFLVFHDAYQYFEHHFGLKAAGAVTTHPTRAPSARRVTELRATILHHGARCVFHEPQFSDAVLKIILENTPARRGQLDPLGVQLDPGPDAYFDMMAYNMEVILDCLRTP